MNQRLNDCVVGSVGVAVEREGALALAVERRVASRRNYPFLCDRKETRSYTMGIYDFGNVWLTPSYSNVVVVAFP